MQLSCLLFAPLWIISAVLCAPVFPAYFASASSLTMLDTRYSLLCLSDPGRVEFVEDAQDCAVDLLPLDSIITAEARSSHESSQQFGAPLDSEAEHSSRCTACAHNAPLRAHHCHSCQCCVRAFDHHCFWIGSCIGERNHVRFVVYLCVQTAVLVMALSFIGESLQHSVHPLLHAAEVVVILCLFGALVMVGGLAVFHVYLLSTGQTTREVTCYLLRFTNDFLGI